MRRRQDEPEERSPRAALVALVLLASCAVAILMVSYLLASRRAVGEFGFPLDDSWIHVRFAQHLARGEGFSFNPGEPTSTTTSALWTLVLALAYRVTREALFTSAVVNGLLAVTLCVVVFHLSLTMVRSPWVALAAGLLVAVTTPLAWWALSGMEPMLYAVLGLLGVLLHVRERKRGPLRGLLPTVAFALAGLARPECLLLFPLALLDRLVMARWVDGRERWLSQWVKDAAVHVPVFLLISAPPFVYNHLVTGYPLPSSFYSKQQWMSISGAVATGDMRTMAQVLAVAPWREMGSVVAAWAADDILLVAPFFIGLVWLVWQTCTRRLEHGSLLIPMALVVQPAVWALLAGYRPADYQSQRYIASLNPLFLLVGVVGGWWVTERAAALRARSARLVLVAAAVAASLARQPAGAATYALNVKNTTEMQVAIGRWVRDHVPRGSVLAVNDVGAIATISDHAVLDLQGLVTPEVLELRSLKRRADGTAPQALSGYLFSREPDYLIIFPDWYPELAARRDLFTPVFGVRLTDNVTCGGSVMVVYRTVWATAHGREETE